MDKVILALNTLDEYFDPHDNCHDCMFEYECTSLSNEGVSEICDVVNKLVSRRTKMNKYLKLTNAKECLKLAECLVGSVDSDDE